MEKLRVYVETIILDICSERNLPTAPVLKSLKNLSDEQLEKYFEESFIKLN